jgi:tRNA (adenine58-N1)-methyltransferase non-catalytic subunit
MHDYIQPYTYILLRLPSESLKLVEILPNTNISIGKYGSFPANLLLGRPYNVTFEVVDKLPDQNYNTLRIVPASELNEDVLAEEASTNVGEETQNGDKTVLEAGDGVEYELVGENGQVVMRTNRVTIDDPTNQKMTMEEIEVLKREGSGAGKDLIARLMLSHSSIDQKTQYSLAKYTLRKTKKFLRRFTVLALDVTSLAEYMLVEKDPGRIMEIREETLALMLSWANVRYTESREAEGTSQENLSAGVGRWLVVDDTGGLVVAAMAERMGILYPTGAESVSTTKQDTDQGTGTLDFASNKDDQDLQEVPIKVEATHTADKSLPDASDLSKIDPQTNDTSPQKQRLPRTYPPLPQSAQSNTITVLHPASQPNVSLLKHFGYDTANPTTTHPLHTHLKTISYLQLLYPDEDSAFTEPPVIPDDELKKLKAGKRGNYFRKRRRWERVKTVVDETRAGGFDGLLIASSIDLKRLLEHTVPLLRGAAQIVIYSPYVEPLAEIADLYSTARRTAYTLANIPDSEQSKEDFPLNPTLLLAPMVQTSRVRKWQCLPGRTHPTMTARGASEGFLLTATRVLPAEGKVEARGKHKKKKAKTQHTADEAVDGVIGDKMDIDSTNTPTSGFVTEGQSEA